MEDIVAITNLLSESELKSIRKLLKGDKQKLRLITLLTEQKISSIEILIEKLNYQNNKSAFYTIKHRLLQDIINFKFSQGKNQVIKTKEEISNLRTLLYSNQPKLLEKKLNDLLKRTDDIELYNGKREIYLCMYILHYNDKNKRKTLKPLLTESQYKEHIFYKMESVFFSIIFKSQDLFYNSGKKRESLSRGLKKMKQLDEILHSKISNFLYKSSLLTVQLNTGIIPDLEEIRELYLNYVSTPLQYYYPNCKLAIKCLFCKYYYHTENWDKFKAAINELKEDINEIKGYRTYEDIYYFYLFSLTLLHLKNKKYEKLHQFIEHEINDNVLGVSSNKMIYSLMFLRGVGQFYNANYKRASMFFLKAQSYRKWLNDENKWADIENSVFLILCHTMEENEQLITHEVQYIKRKAKENQIDIEKLAPLFDLILKRKKQNDASKQIRIVKEQQELHSTLKLLDIDYTVQALYNSYTVPAV